MQAQHVLVQSGREGPFWALSEVCPDGEVPDLRENGDGVKPSFR